MKNPMIYLMISHLIRYNMLVPFEKNTLFLTVYLLMKTGFCIFEMWLCVDKITSMYTSSFPKRYFNPQKLNCWCCNGNNPLQPLATCSDDRTKSSYSDLKLIHQKLEIYSLTVVKKMGTIFARCDTMNWTPA